MSINKGFANIPKNYLFKEVGNKKAKLTAKLGPVNDIIAIGVGDPDIPTSYHIRNTISENSKTYRGYPDYEGIPELRQEISNWYKKRFMVNVSPDQILVGDGAKSDISHLALAFSNPGEKAVLQNPAYPVYLNWSRFCNLDVHFIECTQSNNFLGEIPKEALTDKLALTWLCNPNNPTGAVTPLSYLEDIVQKSKKASKTSVVIHDIAYADFRPGKEAPYSPSIFEVTEAEDIGIEVGSFSKPFSMTGDRLSWVAIKDKKLMQAWRQLRTNFDSGVPVAIQLGGIVALKYTGVKRAVEENMIRYKNRAEIIKQGFNSMGIDVTGLDHSPYGWVQVPRGYTSKQFASRILEEAHVITLWGSGFGECGEGFIRTTVFQKSNKLQEAMNRIKNINW